MATRTAAKAAPRKKQATPKRAAGTRTKAAAPPRNRSAASKSPAVKKPAAKKAAAQKTQAAKAPAAAPRAKATASRRTPARGASKSRTSRAPKPKAMEVSYSGRIFRSRLEARWAIFLDLLQVNWDYEPSFYQVGEDLFYLPDFFVQYVRRLTIPLLDFPHLNNC